MEQGGGAGRGATRGKAAQGSGSLGVRINIEQKPKNGLRLAEGALGLT